MKRLPYQPSAYEEQLAMAILAHAVRHDNDALAASLDLLELPSTDLHPTCVIAVLINEFQNGMDTYDKNQLAEWFSSQALICAAAASGFGNERG